MHETGTLADLIKRNKLEEAKQRLEQGEKLSKDLSEYDRSQVYSILTENRAFDILNTFVKDGTIETDIYEYEKLDKSIFPKLFKTLGNDQADLDFVKNLLDNLDNINDAVEDNTLLGLAFINSAPIGIIRLLTDAGCNVHYKNNYEEGFLYKIVQEYDIKEGTGVQYLDLLIGEGLDPNAGNIVGETPLHLAISKNKKQYIEFLLQHGSDPNQQNKNGETPFYAVLVNQCRNLDAYNMFKEYAPADFNIVNKEGETLLIGVIRMRRSASENDLQLLRALIEDGADVYQTSPYYGNERSALGWISEYPSDVLKAVLETGAVVLDHKDDEGNTLLHKVCAYNVNYDQEAARQLYRKVKLLIEYGADVNAVNDLDKTAMDLAAQDNLKSKTIELLLKHKV